MIWWNIFLVREKFSFFHTVNYGNSLSRTFGKNSVKVTVLLNKLLKRWFDEIFFGWERISRFSTLWVNTKSNKNFVGWVRFITMHIGANLPTFPVNKFFPYYLCPRKWHVLLLFLTQCGKTKNSQNISWNQLHSTFPSNTVAFTKFLS